MAMVITFSSGKGGTGKTTVIEAVASFIHYGTPYRVAVYDCDPQLSFYNDRILHLGLMNELGPKSFSKIFYTETAEKKPIYPVKKITVKEFLPELKLDDTNFDIILVDTPGVVDKTLMATVMPFSDLVLIPTHPDEKTTLATVEYAKYAKKFMELPGTHLSDVRLFYSKYTASAMKNEFNDTREYLARITGVHFMEKNFFDRKEVQKGNFSTLLPFKGCDDKDHFLHQFSKEIIDIITQN